MPQIILGDSGKTLKRQNDFRKAIKAQMTASDMTQEALGMIWGISQPAAGKKIKRLQIGYEDLVKMFAALEFTDEQILKAMKG